MDSFSHVVKSKSSNSAIISKSADKRYQKNSGSSFALQKLNHVKKRGVYVEKKSCKNENKKGNIPSPNTPSRTVQARPNNKHFLSSVLKILSKSTTGTQYPDDPNKCSNKSTGSIRYCHSPKRNSKRAETATLPLVSKKNSTRNTINNKKPKTIRPANSKFDDQKAVIVLQPKRQIIQTPSNYSERSYKDMTDPAVWNKLPCLVNYADSEDYIDGTKAFDQGVCTQVCKEENEKTKNIEIIKKDNENASSVGAKKSDKALYNFFVDLLKTTISVYNMKPEYDHQSKSNIKFEMEEEVANKLNINLTNPGTACSECYRHTINEILSDEEIEKLDNLWLSRSKPKPKPKTKTKPYEKTERRFRNVLSPIRPNITRKNIYNLPLPYSTPNRKPHFSRKTRKRRFLNLLKQELQMKDDAYEEPQSLYDALRIIAKTKRKEAIRSSILRKTVQEPECKFDINRRRNIMTPARPKQKKMPVDNNYNHTNIKKDNFNLSRRNRAVVSRPTLEIAKKHIKSLEVIGFDYEQSDTKTSIPENYDSSSGSSDTTVCNRFSFDTEMGDQSSKYQIYNNWLSGKGGPPWEDLKSYIYAEDD